MNENIFTYSLEFPSFSIDFEVDRQLSVEWTQRFDYHGPDFVYVVAETWLNAQNVRHLIIPMTRPANLIEEFKHLSMQLCSSTEASNLQNLIPRGGWAAWMRGYWDRLNADTAVPDDEENYEKLIPLSLLDSRVGHLAAYVYNGEPTIEVATRSMEGGAVINVWSAFDPKKTAGEIHELQQSMKAKILSFAN